MRCEPGRWDDSTPSPVQDVGPDTTTVDLGENIADVIQLKITIELNVGDLILLGNGFQLFAERACIGCMSCGDFGCSDIASLHGLLTP